MNIATYIDHTALKPETTQADVSQLCLEAMQYGFASVCINSSFVSHAKEQLQGSDVKVCSVIGFPLGACSSASKLYESSVALEDFADELDMVINVGRLKSGDVDYVREEIRNIADCAHSYGKIVKVIIETALLTDDEKRLACALAKEAGADFVKTSTGFSGGGATTADIALMRSIVGPDMGVKASGGISTYAAAQAMIDAGATRIGASKGIAIVTNAPKSDDGSY